MIVLAATLAACGSSASSKSAIRKTCQQVAAVLSDGPDPGADPIGYAEAQVLPLRQIKTSQKVLQRAIDELASAYHAFSSDGDDHQAARTAVAVASRRINVICPGAAQ